MPHRRGFRLVAVLAALLFFAGEVGTSELDALLFHSGGAPVVITAGPHVESGSAGAQDHADHCLLMFRLPNGRTSAGITMALRVARVTRHPSVARPPAVPHRFYPGLHQQSRAPPAALV